MAKQASFYRLSVRGYDRMKKRFGNEMAAVDEGVGPH